MNSIYLDTGNSIYHCTVNSVYLFHKDILGHSSMQSTTVYTHFNVKSLKKILKLYHPRENELYEEVDEEEVLKKIER